MKTVTWAKLERKAEEKGMKIVECRHRRYGIRDNKCNGVLILMPINQKFTNAGFPYELRLNQRTVKGKTTQWKRYQFVDYNDAKIPRQGTYWNFSRRDLEWTRSLAYEWLCEVVS